MNLDDLRPAPYNPRTISPEALAGLRASVRELGDLGGLTWNRRTGHLVCGHQRLAALKAEYGSGLRMEGEAVVTPGGDRFPVRVVDWPEDRERLGNLVANNPHIAGTFTADAAIMLDEIKAAMPGEHEAMRLPELTESLLDELVEPEREPQDAEPQVDRAEELREKWGVKSGDLWKLGEHRLLCGDSTKAEDVGRVMGGEKAQMVYTDPPYGVDYDGGTKVTKKLSGDANTDLYMPACRMSAGHSDDKAPLYLWHAGVKGIAAAAAAAAAAAGYEIRCEIVWNKNLAQYGALSAQYKQKHEPLYYCFKSGKAPRWFGPTNEITVWDCNRSQRNDYHPTQKPVELAERALGNSTERGDIVADWFLGSGATLIACENLGRKCRAIEISPAYVAVALQRWADATGKTPERIA